MPVLVGGIGGVTPTADPFALGANHPLPVLAGYPDQR